MRIASNGAVGEIDNLPGCSQVAVFHSAFVSNGNRGKGLGDKAHKERLTLARKLGYDMAICTVRRDNLVQEKLLKRNGWNCATGFNSSKTNNRVRLWTKHLKEEDGEVTTKC